KLALVLGALALAGAPAAYLMWPRWIEPIAPDAPSLPIIVGGVTFNVPPAAIRVPMQRRPGAQARIDIVLLWPSLSPPDLAAKAGPAATPDLSERVFVTIAASDGTLPPLERLQSIYPRYAEGSPVAGGDGLIRRPFRADTPYQGEELIHPRTEP